MDRLAEGQCRSVRFTERERVSYPLVIDDLADIDGGLGVLPQISLLLEDEAVSALPTQLCASARVDTNAGVKKGHVVYLHTLRTSHYHTPFTRLGGVLHSGASGRGLAEAADGDWLVYQEESADHLPLAGPEKSYTVQREPHTT